MSMFLTQTTHRIAPVLLPAPRTQIHVRAARMDDLPFIDALQKAHHKMLGFMPRKQLEGKIAAGHVLVAEGARSQELEVRRAETEEASASGLLTSNSQLLAPPPLGYIIGNDRYFKREDVGVIYQLCVVPGVRRGLVGAALVKAMFERSAYGCRLFCCWCAQDIDANRFWESLGFIPLAFRAGSRKKGRIHIFWQKRIRAGDITTPYWYPSQTGAGLIREDRLVLPIPPGTHWSDAKPMVLPGETDAGGQRAEGGRQRTQLTRGAPSESALCRLPSAYSSAPITRPKGRPAGGLWFAPQPKAAASQSPESLVKAKAKRQRPPVARNDARRIAAARELRDRYLEELNRDPSLLPSAGKYDVARHFPDLSAPAPIIEVKALPLAA